MLKTVPRNNCDRTGGSASMSPLSWSVNGTQGNPLISSLIACMASKLYGSQYCTAACAVSALRIEEDYNEAEMKLQNFFRNAEDQVNAESPSHLSGSSYLHENFSSVPIHGLRRMSQEKDGISFSLVYGDNETLFKARGSTLLSKVF